MVSVERRAPAARREIALLISLGIALRVLWMILAHSWTEPINVGEASNAALAFARTGTIADAFFPGQGPTAHLLPTTIVIAGSIERLLGPDSPAANVALAGWALLQMAVGYLLSIMLFHRLGARRATLLGALALLCLLPAFVAQEAADFRVWEGALAYDLAVANLLWIVVLRERPAIDTRALVIAAVLAAFAFFVSPPAGVAAVACWALVAWRLRVEQAARLALFALIAVAALIVPWTIRNQSAMGETVWLRSNFGLELAIANHDGAIDPASPRAALTARMTAVHPGAKTAEALRAAGGEVVYSRRLGERTWRWIAAHPGDFARLSLRHYRQFYVPDTWEEASTNWNGANRIRIVTIQLVGALGLAGLAIGLIRRRQGYPLLALYVAVAGLPYALVQPIPRYSYIVYPLLAFLGTQLVADAVGACRRTFGIAR